MGNNFNNFLKKPGISAEKYCRLTIISCIFSLLILTALHPVSGEYANEGMDLYAAGEFNKSIDWFENALETTQGSDRAPLLNNIGAAYLALGFVDKAKEQFNEAVTANSSYGVAWINLGVANEKIGKTDEALQNYDKAIEVDAANAGTSLIKKAGLLTVLGKYDDALSVFKMAESEVRDVDQMALYTGMGAVYYLQKNYAESEKAFNQAIDLDPDNAALAYYNLGVLKASEKKYDEAKTALQQAIKISPSGMEIASELLNKLDNLTLNGTST